MKITTLLPTTDNDGSAFPESQLDAIVQGLAVEFGGCSVEGTTDGIWFDDGTEYRDTCLRVTVVCNASRLEDIRNRVIAIGRELGQLAMYFEVRDYDGVQFLRMD